MSSCEDFKRKNFQTLKHFINLVRELCKIHTLYYCLHRVNMIQAGVLIMNVVLTIQYDLIIQLITTNYNLQAIIINKYKFYS